MSKDRVFFYLCENFKSMNYIDIIVWITLALAFINGWRQGAVVQGCSILGILIGVWLATKHGTSLGLWLHIDAQWAAVGGFLILFLAVIIGVGLVSRLVRSIFKFAGLGVLDSMLGVVLSIFKYAVILSLLFGAFDGLNNQFKFVSKSVLAESKFYAPVKNFSAKIFPAVDWTQKQISDGLDKL